LDSADTNTQFTNTDIGFLPCFLLELDMRSDVCCANRLTV